MADKRKQGALFETYTYRDFKLALWQLAEAHRRVRETYEIIEEIATVEELAVINRAENLEEER